MFNNLMVVLCNKDNMQNNEWGNLMKKKLSRVSNIEKCFEVFKILAFLMCSACMLSHFSHV